MLLLASSWPGPMVQPEGPGPLAHIVILHGRPTITNVRSPEMPTESAQPNDRTEFQPPETRCPMSC